jgi:nitrite reductase/ring-hydroxylating ferredoxin subunit/uncharacterized membrane protein
MALNDTVRDAVERLGASESIDRLAKPLASAVADALGGNATVKDALSGTWLGHPVHPMLTDLPIGSWTSAWILDVVGGERGRDAAQMLVGIGVLAALPTAASGMSDWSDTIGEERRIGGVHAAANAAALSLYTASWLARRRGRHGVGVALGHLGAAAATAGGYLGAHLVYRRGIGADRNAWKHASDEWIDVADDVALAAGKELVVDVGDDQVLVSRRGSRTTAISNVCGHAGGPLNEGTFDEEGCVTCPWHGSVFRLDDGHVVHGPATGHQPCYEVRSEGGRISVRRARPAS